MVLALAGIASTLVRLAVFGIPALHMYRPGAFTWLRVAEASDIAFSSGTCLRLTFLPQAWGLEGIGILMSLHRIRGEAGS